uniref:Dynactin subunit 5 n=1 Tax=Caenorhabditis japonica TaxID=281687 RepID=A0A8R1HS14_CAEJA
MDLPIITYDETEWAKTHTGNKVHKQHKIAGTQNIIIAGKTIVEKGVSIRGDLAAVKIGKCCVLKERCLIRPCLKIVSKKPTMWNVNIGDYVFIEEDCVINASQIHAYVHIGARSILGNGCVIRECSRVLPDTVVSPDALFPPFSTIGGNPENVWGLLARAVYRHGKQFQTVGELKDAVTEEWDKLQPSFLESLTQSMSNRLCQVMQKFGGPTSY